MSLDLIREHTSNALASAARYHHGNFTDDYEVMYDKVLGSGYSGEVVVAKSLATGRRSALKRIQKSGMSPEMLKQFIAEVEIGLMLDHPNVVRLDDIYDTPSEFSLLTECLEGGELVDRLAELNTFPEALAADTTKQMLRAVGYLHSHNIVHRDLKMENLIYESKEPDAQLKVIDFGFAKVWDSSKPFMQASCGSVAYVSPDVLAGKGYTSKCDLWSVGVLVFMLLSGYPPFHGRETKVIKKILAADVDWRYTQRWANVSQDAIDFVKALLTLDAGKRLGAQAALNHRWLTTTSSNRKPVLSAAAVRSIDSYVTAPCLRRAILQLVAREVTPKEITELRRIFLELAGEEEGTIRLSELKAAIRGDDSSQVPTSEPKTPSRKLRRAKTNKLKELFQVLDINGDDQIYYSDFLAATMNDELKLRDEYLWAAFNRLDADNSGSISVDDIENTIGGAFEGVEMKKLMRDAGLIPAARVGISYESFVGVLKDRNGHALRSSSVWL